MPKKQKSGLYRASVTVGGKRIYVSGHSMRELQAQKARVRRQFQTGQAPRDITFVDLVRQWWTRVQLPTLSRPGTVAAYKCLVNRYIIGGVDDRKLAKAIRRVDIQQIIDKARPHRKEQSLVHIRHLLSQICKYGMETGCISADYAHHANVDKPDEQKHERKQALTDEQIEALLTATDGQDVGVPIRLMYFLGLRYGEAIGLYWSNIDLQQRTITIDHQRLASGQDAPPKTESSNRIVRMPDQLVQILAPIRQLPSVRVVDISRQMLINHWAYTLYLSGRATLKEGKQPRVDHRCYDIDFAPHSLRHTFTSKLYEAGVDLLVASRMLGHSSIQVTADVYTHLTYFQQKKAVQDVTAVFSKSCRKVAKDK